MDGRGKGYDLWFRDMISISNTQNLTDKFKTLCHIAADVSETPCSLKPGKSGGLCYHREYQVVLMVGLTELKAKICWFDPQTVRIHGQYLLNCLC